MKKASRTRTTRTTQKKTTTTRTTTTTEPRLRGAVYFGLGANLGDREATLRWALRQLESIAGPLEVASLYRTAPIVAGVVEPNGPDYLNTVARGRVELAVGARRLLFQLKDLERRAGRRPTARDAPRPLDIDLLLAGDRVLDLPRLDSEANGSPSPAAARWPGGLVLPHPRLRRRRFVLEPLVELAGDEPLPPDGRTPRQLLAALGEQQAVERIGWSAAF